MIIFLYIIWDIIFPFLLALGIISAILLMNQIYQLLPYLLGADLNISELFQIVVYSLPPILMIAAPISLVVGVYAGISRISTDYELVVMRASGISLSYLYKPVLFVSVLVSAMVMIQTFYLSPICILKMEELKFNILKKQTKLDLVVQKINNFFGQKLIYIFEEEGDQFRGVFISDWDLTESSVIIEAKRGRIFQDNMRQKVIFKLFEGKIHMPQNDDLYRIIEFQQMDYNLPLPGSKKADLQGRQDNKDSNRKEKMDTELTVNELLYRIESSTTDSSDYFEYVDEFHGRIVIVLSCLCFAFFALPISIQNPRNPKILSILFLFASFVVYYYIFVQTRFLLAQGKTQPFMIYTPLILSIVVGFYNYTKTNYNYESLKQIVLSRFTMGIRK